MEDEIIVSDDNRFFAVFDGHGGAGVSKYLEQNTLSKLDSCLPKNNPTEDSISKAIADTLLAVDGEVVSQRRLYKQGSTACALYLHSPSDSSPASIITANIGDSRAVLARKGSAIDLSVDHKPNSPSERSRIESVGGYVKWHGNYKPDGKPDENTGVYRVNGNLALSRAIGDAYERPAMTPEPDITVTKGDTNDDFVIVATDGLWDVLTSQEAVQLVYDLIGEYKKEPEGYSSLSQTDKVHFKALQTEQVNKIKSQMARIFTQIALKRGSWDNITVLVLWLREV